MNEEPEWRQETTKTSKLLSDVVDFYKKYEKLPQSAKHFCKTTFVKIMTVEFVLNVNVAESVGTQTEAGTRAVLDNYIMGVYKNGEKQSNDSGGRGSETVTINIYKALEQFHKFHEEMENTGKLTVPRICDFHRVLMADIPEHCKRAGEMRKNIAYVLWDQRYHTYPDPAIVEILFDACIDHHSIHMTRYKKLAEKGPSVESFSYLFRCASRLLFDFVDAHPFSDGNGRMCRLLANYVLTLITPFPVALYMSSTCGGRSGREDYLNAIVECRMKRKKGPGTLAAMLIEGTWRGWKNLFSILEQNNLLTPTVKVIGPIVVKKSEDVQQRNERMMKVFKRFSVEVQSDMVERITKAINDANVSADDQDDNADIKRITLCVGIELHLHIYN